MNIFVTSDTHGRIENAVRVYERLASGIIIDHIIHCGDNVRDAEELGARLHLPVTYAPGNCDGSRSREFSVLETPAGKILVIHGHTESVDRGLMRLTYLAAENDCVMACFGHTHVPVYETVTIDGDDLPDGNPASKIKLLNPGSASRPRDGSSGSCALIVATERALTASIVYVEGTGRYGSGGGRGNKKESRGGYLRGLMNYSDRL